LIQRQNPHHPSNSGTCAVHCPIEIFGVDVKGLVDYCSVKDDGESKVDYDMTMFFGAISV